MSGLTDDEVRQFLIDNGYPNHIVKAGREGIVRRWRQFVDEVEQGYQYGLEDYRNDLDLRGAIGMLGLAAEVADADQRLEELLVEREVRVWESLAGDAPWDWGYPRNANKTLLADLASAGLI
jgi:hypothetical protein